MESNQKETNTFIRATLSLILQDCLNECRKTSVQKQLQEVICDPLLDYCIRQLTPYFLLLVIIFIVLLIVISILLAFIISGSL